MSIELTCLGGAAAWPNPGQGCSSYLVRSGETTILLDAGSDTFMELRKHADYRELDAVVISHGHSDHVLDLVPYRYGLIYGPAQAEKPIAVWLRPDSRRVLDSLASAFSAPGENPDSFWDRAFSLQEYDPVSGLDLGATRLTFARTAHPGECFAMRVASPDGVSLTYTADTGTIESVLELARGSDVLICEATMPEDTQQPGRKTGHLKPSEAGILAKEAGVGTLVLTHLWSERPDSEVLEAAGKSFTGRTIIAKPGLTVNA